MWTFVVTAVAVCDSCSYGAVGLKKNDMISSIHDGSIEMVQWKDEKSRREYRDEIH